MLALRIYDAFPVISAGQRAEGEFMAAYWSRATLIRDDVEAAEVSPHLSPFSLKTVMRGSETYVAGGREIVVRPGTFLLTPPGVAYGSRVAPVKGRGGTRSLSAHFPAAVVRQAARGWDGALEDEGADAGGRDPDLGEPLHLRPLDGAAAALVAGLDRTTDAATAEALGMDLLAFMLGEVAEGRTRIAALPSARPAVRAELYRRVMLARDRLEAEPGRAWTLAELGREACLSPFHLHRLFRAALGVTPMAFLRELRIRRAEALLRTTWTPVSQVAAEVGFESFSAFSRCFRRARGMAPSDCRRA